MKKKLFSALLAGAMVVPCAFATACGDDPATGLTKADYKKALESVSASCAQYVSTPVASPSSITFGESDFVDMQNPNAAKSMAQSALWLVLFLKNVCGNEDYDVTDETEDSIATDERYTYNIRFSMAVDPETENINVKISADYEGSPYLIYLVVDVDYDFENSNLNEFSLYGFNGSKENKTEEGVAYFKWKGMNAKQLSTEAEGYSTFAQGIISDMNAMWALPKSETPYDFSAEYNSAGQEAQEIMSK